MFDQQSLRSACANARSDQSLCQSLDCSMTIKLLTEHHFKFLSLKGGCRSSSESTYIVGNHMPWLISRLFFSQVKFDDSNKDGQMLVTLTADLQEVTCQGNYSNQGELIILHFIWSITVIMFNYFLACDDLCRLLITV